jgi:uncharacterized membrane protein YkoI
MAFTPVSVAFDVSKSDAVSHVLRKYPGKLLSAKTEQGKRGKYYAIKLIMKDGRVKSVNVDASTGKIIN